MRLCLLTLLVAGCTPDVPEKEPPCERVRRYQDDDADGYGDIAKAFDTCSPERGVENGDDCDDGDPAIHPDAEEDCAVAVDANCDGSIGYDDQDADGSPACEDCDDTDPLRSPDAPEYCDEWDSNCNGELDDSPIDGFYFYADADADGFGAEDDRTRACEQPEGFVEDLTDCDDTRADVNPGATELCNEVDDNCDGDTDDAYAADAPTWYRDGDEDGWGDDETSSVSCEAPRRHVLEAGDCDDDDAEIHPGATEVCNAVDDDCDGGTDDAEATDARAWFMDADLDGYGVATGYVYSCELPEGGSLTSDDCDDADGTAYPGAPESCDEVDDDCDGTVDEDPTDAPTWYTDADGDGYGDDPSTADTCDMPAGTAASSTDCNDADGSISPLGIELCNGVDDDCDRLTDEGAADATTWYADDDGDGYGDAGSSRASCTQPSGYVADATDCDDTDASVLPGAAETCDGEDDDCDGTVDEPDATDATAWYTDADGDGYGDAAIATTACDAPVGTVAADTDCDDGDAAFHPGAAEADCADPNDYNCDGSVGAADADGDGHAACAECDDGDAAVFPGAAETCNDVDDDCDGVADETGATGGPDWYADADGDGYGDAADALSSCAAPTGYVAADTDCDDLDPAVSPDAGEDCATAYDDDCDGVTNTRNADNCTRWYWDYDGDGYGSTSNACLCEASGYLTATSSNDCDDGDAEVSPGARESWGNGLDDDCDDIVDVVTVTQSEGTLAGGASNDQAGRAVAGAGDLDGDGYDDMLIGAPENDILGAASGAAYVVYGPLSESLGLTTADAVLAGEAAGDAAGTAVAAAGDVDGDGFGDLLVSATQTGGSNDGSIYLLLGPVSGTIGLGSADAEWTGAMPGDAAGTSLAGGADLDDDGIADLLLGAYTSDAGGTSSGGAWVASGLTTGVNSLTTASVQLVGEDRSDYAGYRVRITDDFSGDGVPDVFIGAHGDDDAGSGAGAAYIVFGPLSGTIDLATSDLKLTGEDSSDSAGVGLAAPGDVDGDGLDDLLVGAEQAGTAGAAYLVLGGGTSGSLADAAAIVQGTSTGEGLGFDVAGVGDVNGDGSRDVLLGAAKNDDNGTDAGAAYLFFGPISGTLDAAEADGTLEGSAASDYAGWALAGAGDTNGDGFSDFLIGAYGADEGGSGAGTTYLFLGR